MLVLLFLSRRDIVSKKLHQKYVALCSVDGNSNRIFENCTFDLISAREKLAVYDVTNLPYMDVN